MSNNMDSSTQKASSSAHKTPTVASLLCSEEEPRVSSIHMLLHPEDPSVPRAPAPTVQLGSSGQASPSPSASDADALYVLCTAAAYARNASPLSSPATASAVASTFATFPVPASVPVPVPALSSPSAPAPASPEWSPQSPTLPSPEWAPESPTLPSPEWAPESPTLLSEPAPTYQVPAFPSPAGFLPPTGSPAASQEADAEPDAQPAPEPAECHFHECVAARSDAGPYLSPLTTLLLSLSPPSPSPPAARPVEYTVVSCRDIGQTAGIVPLDGLEPVPWVSTDLQELARRGPTQVLCRDAVAPYRPYRLPDFARFCADFRD